MPLQTSPFANGIPGLGPSPKHMPMARVVVWGASMDLVMLDRTSGIHISIAAERAAGDDLRLAYR